MACKSKKSLQNILLKAANDCGEWMLKNQVNDNRFDANRGRGIQKYNKCSGIFSLTSGWRTGIMCMAMLAMYRRTKDKRYIIAAEAAGHYIISLQIMDQREERFFGAFREHTPQSDEFCPRDSTTAAWALVWLFNETQNREYLYRAKIFGDWMLNFGMVDNWPLYIIFTNKKAVDINRKAAFQSGTGLFFYDLFIASGDSKYILYGLKPIALKYRDEFMRKDGSVIQEMDRFSNKELSNNTDMIEVEMHVLNDDFGNAMLQAASDILGDESFRNAALKNTLWSKEKIFDLEIPNNCLSSLPVVMMYCYDLGLHYNDERLVDLSENLAKKILSIQFHDSSDAKLNGAFKGADEGSMPEGHNINMRMSAYALIAMLKLESNLPNVWLGRNNEKFKDVIPDPIDDVLPW